MNIIQLLRMDRFDTNKKTMLIRHTSGEVYDINEIYENGELLNYQSVQSQDVFKDIQYIVAFIATRGTKAKFVGIYEIIRKSKVKDEKGTTKFVENLGIENFYTDNKFYYEQKETTYLSDLKDRLIIEWGKGTVKWHQKLRKKEVVEILPKGYYDNFPGFENIILKYNELKKIINNPDANKEWHTMLSSVAGIYLILDRLTGKQYIGSAYGKEGILGRWKEYCKNADGGDKVLLKLLKNNPNYSKNFQYSILRTLSKTITEKEAISIEAIYKKKLGSKAFGLNLN
ncbi:GIY-YIG nuclease family protein [Clostridium ljungdahlii]|uniref:GIY-YIG domain-containing protein n=1 Tax=Clostridium ljungdahlii TaxID=1538 RepID=A0A168PJ73_9CLOT|nr:GIY-YIG nuclease family protein [Clostridium ljungdahlii]OAA87810.1 hypothetical protein WY13_01925 [Clostridium ljungdahlii]